MFGFRFIKVQPTTYLLQYVNGRVYREGRGLAFFYFAPTASLVAIPMESTEVPFIFNLVSSDFQQLSLQGQITFRVVEPQKIAELLNFTLDPKRQQYVSDDPEKLPERLINQAQVLMQTQLAELPLREALAASTRLVDHVLAAMRESVEVKALGLEILGLSLIAIKPNPETARALEADVREQLLKEADQATYARRNAAVEQERAIRENELNTEIAVENKKRQIREAQMDAEQAVQAKQQQLQETQMQGKITLEKINQDLLTLATQNLKQEADARAYSLTVTMQALAGVDARVLQVLASVDMDASRLVALAFRDLADGAERIGQLNISPDLLQELLAKSNSSDHAT